MVPKTISAKLTPVRQTRGSPPGALPTGNSVRDSAQSAPRPEVTLPRGETGQPPDEENVIVRRESKESHVPNDKRDDDPEESPAGDTEPRNDPERHHELEDDANSGDTKGPSKELELDFEPVEVGDTVKCTHPDAHMECFYIVVAIYPEAEEADIMAGHKITRNLDERTVPMRSLARIDKGLAPGDKVRLRDRSRIGRNTIYEVKKVHYLTNSALCWNGDETLSGKTHPITELECWSRDSEVGLNRVPTFEIGNVVRRRSTGNPPKDYYMVSDVRDGTAAVFRVDCKGIRREISIPLASLERVADHIDEGDTVRYSDPHEPMKVTGQRFTVAKIYADNTANIVFGRGGELRTFEVHIQDLSYVAGKLVKGDVVRPRGRYSQSGETFPQYKITAVDYPGDKADCDDMKQHRLTQLERVPPRVLHRGRAQPQQRYGNRKRRRSATDR